MNTFRAKKEGKTPTREGILHENAEESEERYDKKKRKRDVGGWRENLRCPVVSQQRRMGEGVKRGVAVPGGSR